MTTHDILIIGGGPTGLGAAGAPRPAHFAAWMDATFGPCITTLFMRPCMDALSGRPNAVFQFPNTTVDPHGNHS